MKSDKVCCVTTAFHKFVCSTTNSPSITSFQQQCQIRNEYSSWVKLSVLSCYKFSVTSFKEVKLDYLFNSLNKHKFIVLITKDNWKKKDRYMRVHAFLSETLHRSLTNVSQTLKKLHCLLQVSLILNRRQLKAYVFSVITTIKSNRMSYKPFLSCSILTDLIRRKENNSSALLRLLSWLHPLKE